MQDQQWRRQRPGAWLAKRRAKGQRMRSWQRGISMTEFVIVTPIALLVMLSLVQFGLAYMAKQTLNNAVFMAARQGAVSHAKIEVMQASLARGLIPFYINAGGGQPSAMRMGDAWSKAQADVQQFAKLEIISPSPQAFEHFGLKEPQSDIRYIPNDNLEYRLTTPRPGPGGGDISIRDANILKLQVTYGYELKVPLVRTVLSKTMCLGVSEGGAVSAWRAQIAAWDPGNCAYYRAGRIPLVAQATVQMQTPARAGGRTAGLGATGAGTGAGSGPGGNGNSGSGGGDGDDNGNGNGELGTFDDGTLTGGNSDGDATDLSGDPNPPSCEG